ncbi:hypothetical protein FDZ71_02950, partial [bacterium]
MLNKIRMAKENPWKFFKAGGLLQVALGSADELSSLENLDKKLWVALAYPVTGVEFDPKTLALIDTDNDGRIRPPELLEAIRWTIERLGDTEEWFRGDSPMVAESIRENAPERERLLSLMATILKDEGRDDGRLKVEDIEEYSKKCSEFALNGDGIVPPEAAGDEALSALIADIITVVGAAADKSGKDGIDLPLLERFIEEAKAALEWRKAVASAPEILPLGDKTPLAFASFVEVREKIDDYFFRCSLSGFDPRVSESWSFSADSLTTLSTKKSFEIVDSSALLPLAKIEQGKDLPLEGLVNPAWAARLSDFKTSCAEPLMGGPLTALSPAMWEEIKQKLGPYGSYLVSKPGTPLAEREETALVEIISSPSLEAVRTLIESDLARIEDYKLIDTLEKLARYRRDLPVLIKNFINFADFYDMDGTATFQVGTLFIDARSCGLCFWVEDIGKHSALAAPSKLYLAYGEVQRRPDGLKKTICAAFTAGVSH